ncbi:MAG: succinate dehydrogenase, cytochrome b556 subunit [Rhodospirillales bacterium 20-60-12]|nr:MAG: succinate dehydrogenase, cytochrome b556 subunit [Rhodospirillales bacterium 20-60-12]HQT67519.1 succinate dehydrogenase, cytochrome b556 subunit [Acetobacteraceae bacterium]HQU01449.1 succinate dehydrogenase, cytochrome b556 subunit [Acetobacteraceae bacterium]
MHDVRDALMVGRDSKGKLVNRPLSPHLQIYKPQLSSATSIFHRITGVALGLGTILLAVWLVAAASSDHAFALVQSLFASWLGLLILFGFTLALFYHFCNGIRHLAWDAGRGFDLPAMHRSGRIMIAASIVLTIGFWVIGFLVW